MMEHNDFNLPAVTISDWSQVATADSTAVLLRTPLNILWNEAGFAHSLSYQPKGKWNGLCDAPEVSSKMDAAKEKRTIR
jgi:hypothetical protein